MKRKRILTVIIVVLIIVVIIGIFGCQRKPAEKAVEEFVPTEEETGEQEEAGEIAELNQELGDKEREERQEKLQRIDSLLASEAIRWNLSVGGEVKEISISGRNLTIVGFTETGEETSSLIVPISEEAKIISDYILPAGAAKEEITGTITTAGGKEYNLGEKEINLEEIKAGDNVFISLNLKPDYTIEGIRVWVSPVDLFDF